MIRISSLKLCGLLVLASALQLGACGRYAEPLPPESYAPKAISKLEVRPASKGVAFSWVAPEENFIGKEIKDIDGYRLYRKAIVLDADMVNPDVEYELIATIEDTHVLVRDELRKSARAVGYPGRRLDVADTLKKFQYTDLSAKAGERYLYKLVPINQGGVEGQFDQLVKVLFRGESSEISMIKGNSTAEAF